MDDVVWIADEVDRIWLDIPRYVFTFGIVGAHYVDSVSTPIRLVRSGPI